MGSNMDIEENRKQKAEQLRTELNNLKHIKWLQKNIDKYRIGKWTELKERLLEDVSFYNYDAMKGHYTDFIDHFANNPYAYSCPIEEDGEKIVSAYPECYFVGIDVEDRIEQMRREYVSIGFLEDFIRGLEEESSRKKGEELASFISRFLEKEKKMFWIHTYSKAERTYLKNYYECYKDEWKTKHQQEKKRENCTSRIKIFKMISIFLKAVWRVILVCAAMFLYKKNIFFREWKDKLLLLILTILIVEISLWIVSVFQQYKSRTYRRAIKKFETDNIYLQCCNEVDHKFLSRENKPLRIIVAKDYLPNLAKDLTIREKN